jgi:hypothetical protein
VCPKHGVLTTYFGGTGLEATPGELQHHLFLLGEDHGLLVSFDRRLVLVGFAVRHDGCVERRVGSWLGSRWVMGEKEQIRRSSVPIYRATLTCVVPDNTSCLVVRLAVVFVGVFVITPQTASLLS